MSDLIKAQNMPQFNCYTCWTSLGANGVPDNLIKEGLKQPNCIKISFEKGAKEITGHVPPDQAWFGTEYFLAYTLPDFKSNILTRLLAEQKDNGPLLFNLMGQCFQDVGLTKWTSIIAKRCPKDADRTKANLDECIKDYLEAVASFPNVGNQLICWLHTAKKPALMQIHEFMRRQSAASQLPWGWLPPSHDGSAHGAREEWTNLLFAAQGTSIQVFWTWTRHSLLTRSSLLLSSSSVKQPTKRLAFLRRLPRTRSSWKRRKWLIFLPCVAVNRLTSSIVATNIVTTIEATNAIITIANLTIVIKTINTTIVLDTTTRTWRVARPTKRRMIASAMTSRKRATRPWIMTSPLRWARAIFPEEGAVFAQDLLHTLVLGLALAQAAGATTIIMWLRMTASQARPPSTGTCTPLKVMTADISITLTRAIPFLPASLLQRRRKVSAPRNRTMRQQRFYVSHCMSLFQIENQTFWLILTLN